MRMKGGFMMALLFLVGGIVFWVTQPDIWIGQIWVGVAVLLIIVYAFIGIRTLLAVNKLPAGMPPSSTDPFGGLSSYTGPGGTTPGMSPTGLPATGVPADMTINTTTANVPMTAAKGIAAGQAVLAALKQNGIDPTKGGIVDLRHVNAARAAVLKALSDHGIDVAHQVAMASPAVPIQPTQEPVERMSKLKQLHDTGLISEEEYEAQRKKILGEL